MSIPWTSRLSVSTTISALSTLLQAVLSQVVNVGHPPGVPAHTVALQALVRFTFTRTVTCKHQQVHVMNLKTFQALELEAEADKAEAEAQEAELNLHDRLASQYESRQYFFDGELDFETLSACIDTLDEWRRLDAAKPQKSIHLVINGSAGVIQALALHDQIRWLRQDGFKVTVEVAGTADRHLALVLQAANRRIMTARSWLDNEEVRFEFGGDTFLAENEISWMERLEAQQRAILAERSQFTVEQIANRMKFKSWRLSAQEALECGLIDEIATTCAKRLVTAVKSSGETLPAATTTKQRKSAGETRKMRAESELKKLDNAALRASASYNGVVRFINEVDTETAAEAKSDLANALRLSSTKITLLIDSNGGSCTDGFGFIDSVEKVAQSGRAVDTEVLGYAASMGGVMLQVGGKRTMGKNAWLLIHRVSNWFEGATSALKLDHKRCMQIQRQCFELLAARSVFTPEQVLERCRDHDWWISAQEALDYGFIDEIR